MYINIRRLKILLFASICSNIYSAGLRPGSGVSTRVATCHLTFNSKSYTCCYQGCTYTCKNWGSFREHQMKHKSMEKYSCVLCGIHKTSSCYMVEHLSKYHNIRERSSGLYYRLIPRSKRSSKKELVNIGQVTESSSSDSIAEPGCSSPFQLSCDLANFKCSRLPQFQSTLYEETENLIRYYCGVIPYLDINYNFEVSKIDELTSTEAELFRILEE